MEICHQRSKYWALSFGIHSCVLVTLTECFIKAYQKDKLKNRNSIKQVINHYLLKKNWILNWDVPKYQNTSVIWIYITQIFSMHQECDFMLRENIPGISTPYILLALLFQHRIVQVVFPFLEDICNIVLVLHKVSI